MMKYFRQRNVIFKFIFLLNLLLLPILVYAGNNNDNTKCLTSSYPTSPDKVVNCYCSIDFNDPVNTITANKLFRFTTWTDGPGWDSVTIVSQFKVVPLIENVSNADVKVIYNVIGYIIGDDVHLKEEKESQIFKLNKNANFWKIHSPQIQPHISIATAINEIKNIIVSKRKIGKSEAKNITKLENDLKVLNKYLLK